MLEHGRPEAKSFLPQLALAEVTPWRCQCGCASINFQIRGYPLVPPGVRVLAESMFGSEIDPKGVFVYESHGILSGVEVFAYSGDAPQSLPSSQMLRAASFVNRGGPELTRPASKPITGNDDCPCGSGKKFNQCCGKACKTTEIA
jgi:hypothetical protein